MQTTFILTIYFLLKGVKVLIVTTMQRKKKLSGILLHRGTMRFFNCPFVSLNQILEHTVIFKLLQSIMYTTSIQLSILCILGLPKHRFLIFENNNIFILSK